VVDVDRWLLRTQDNFFDVTDRSVLPLNEQTTPLPCILSPSFNFRSFFEIPSDTNRDLSEVKRDLFENSLPVSLTDLKCQFVELGRNELGDRSILGLAFSQSRYEKLLNSSVLISELYFMEALFAQVRISEPTLARVELPDGLFLGLYDDVLKWSRFQSDSSDEQVAMTENYLEENFDLNYEEEEIEFFRKERASGSGWGLLIGKFFPEALPPTLDLLTGRPDTTWRKLKVPLIGLAVMMLVASVLWYGYAWRLHAGLQEWTESRYRKVIGTAAENPRSSLRSRVRRLEKAQSPVFANVYNRFVILDRNLQPGELRVLSMDFRKDRTSIVSLVKSLETAELLTDSLSENERVKSVSIQSSTSSGFESYSFRVKLRVEWT